MDKHIYLNEADTISRNIVKFALTIPENTLGTRVKRELINSASQASSFYKIACFEEAGKEAVEKFNLVLEKAGISKFWLELLKDEGIMSLNRVNELIDGLSDLISHTIHIRANEEKKALESASFAGEWLLED